jgi:hypothetical protein
MSRVTTATTRLDRPATQDVFLAPKPQLTLQEAGVLLGISDRVAMVAERAGFDRLRAIFQSAGIKRCVDLVRVDEEALEAAAVSVSARSGGGEYAAKDGWFRVNDSSPNPSFDGTLRDAVVNCALLHLNRRKAWSPPVFFRPMNSAQYVQCGRADGIAMYGPTVVFRSLGLYRMLRKSKSHGLKATAILDMFGGYDVEGAFEVPVVMALCVRALE